MFKKPDKSLERLQNGSTTLVTATKAANILTETEIMRPPIGKILEVEFRNSGIQIAEQEKTMQKYESYVSELTKSIRGFFEGSSLTDVVQSLFGRKHTRTVSEIDEVDLFSFIRNTFRKQLKASGGRIDRRPSESWVESDNCENEEQPACCLYEEINNGRFSCYPVSV